jgi:long-chain acyl-CoA synthetase
VGGVPDPLKGEIAKAYVVLKPGAPEDADAIIALRRRELAAYKIPRAIQCVRELPQPSTGKIMRRKLTDLNE